MSSDWKTSKPRPVGGLQNLLGNLRMLEQTCRKEAEESQKLAAQLREKALKEAEVGLD